MSISPTLYLEVFFKWFSVSATKEAPAAIAKSIFLYAPWSSPSTIGITLSVLLPLVLIKTTSSLLYFPVFDKLLPKNLLIKSAVEFLLPSAIAWVEALYLFNSLGKWPFADGLSFKKFAENSSALFFSEVFEVLFLFLSFILITNLLLISLSSFSEINSANCSVLLIEDSLKSFWSSVNIS